MLLIKKVVDKIYRRLLCLTELIPVLQILEMWSIVRVLTIVIIVTALILHDSLLALYILIINGIA
jgi:hypothetical protein